MTPNERRPALEAKARAAAHKLIKNVHQAKTPNTDQRDYYELFIGHLGLNEDESEAEIDQIVEWLREIIYDELISFALDAQDEILKKAEKIIRNKADYTGWGFRSLLDAALEILFRWRRRLPKEYATLKGAKAAAEREAVRLLRAALEELEG